MKKKVAIISLGCAKNQVDAEIMLSVLKKAGYEIENEPSRADAVIINTCGFIEAAKAESIENILEIAKLKAESESPISAIIVSGCLAQRYKDELMKELPEVDAAIGVASRDEIAEAVGAALAGGGRFCSFKPIEAYNPGGGRVLSTPGYTAYLKIADGCDNRCTYCAIPYIRGPYKSRPEQEIIDEAKELAAAGVFELNLIAQDTTRYGLDLYGERRLPSLLRKLCGIEGLKWIRLLYAYPDGVGDELIDVLESEEKLVKYIDLPLQHASDRLLKLMNRRGTAAEAKELIGKIRKRMPEAVIRTTFITGFPGETEKDFEILCDFVRELKFDRVGVFAYSAEEGTPAAELEQTVSENTKQERKDIIELIAAQAVEEKNSALIGKELTVVAEGFDKLAECWFGRSSYHAPEVDGAVFFTSEKRLSPGELVRIRITEAEGYDLFGQRV